MPSVWNPNQYEKFKDQRAKPFWDLLALIEPRVFRTAVDLGCGTGELTRELHMRLSCENTVAVDSSEKMLAKAKDFAAPGLRPWLGAIEDFHPPEPLDLIFSNAALQWVPGHESLLPRLVGWLRPGGQLAVQVPANFDHPSHRLAAEVGRELFPARCFESREGAVLPVERYAALLFEQGVREQRCRLEVYGHAMSSGHEVVECTKGTLLTHYQKQLSSEEFESFLQEYHRRLILVIGEGPYFYAFKRILLWGRKA